MCTEWGNPPQLELLIRLLNLPREVISTDGTENEKRIHEFRLSNPSGRLPATWKALLRLPPNRRGTVVAPFPSIWWQCLPAEPRFMHARLESNGVETGMRAGQPACMRQGTDFALADWKLVLF